MNDTGCPSCGRRECDPFVEVATNVSFKPKTCFEKYPFEVFDAAKSFCNQRFVKSSIKTCCEFVNFLIDKQIIPRHRELKPDVDSLEWAITSKPAVRIRGWVVSFFNRGSQLDFCIHHQVKT